jgi:hypothetical protein
LTSATSQAPGAVRLKATGSTGQADEATSDDGRNRLDKRSIEAHCLSCLKHHHTGVGAERLVELIAANINGIDLGRASLEQHICEAPGRFAEVESHPPVG